MRIIINTIFALIIAFIGIFGVFSAPEALAWFDNDAETRFNSYGAGNLDMIIEGSGDISLNMEAGEEVSREAKISNQGSISFDHLVEVGDLEGGLCSELEVEASYNDKEKYKGDLGGLSAESGESLEVSESGDWEFKFTANGSPSHGEVCEFSLSFKSWQTNMKDYENSGFTDQEDILTRLTFRDPDSTDTASTTSNIVLNEFLPDPSGDDYADGIEGEWVELYNNNGSNGKDLSGWKIQDKDPDDPDGDPNHVIDITPSSTYSGSTTIGAKGSGDEWLVVFMKGAVLNNDGDIIELLDENDNVVDSYEYEGSRVSENKSFARIPDGTGDWVDPIPTPGAPNKLDHDSEDSSVSSTASSTTSTQSTSSTNSVTTSTSSSSTEALGDDGGSGEDNLSINSESSLEQNKNGNNEDESGNKVNNKKDNSDEDDNDSGDENVDNNKGDDSEDENEDNNIGKENNNKESKEDDHLVNSDQIKGSDDEEGDLEEENESENTGDEVGDDSESNQEKNKKEDSSASSEQGNEDE